MLCRDDGTTLSHDNVAKAVRRAARAANVPVSGTHRLRHTFCSHLAMRGAPARAIQEGAGHQDLTTTQRYIHLSPAALEQARSSQRRRARGEIVETEGGQPLSR